MKRDTAPRLLAIVFMCASIQAPHASLAGDGEASDSGAIRIGYVDYSRALNEVSDGRRAKKRLEDEFKEKQQQLSKLQSELKSLKERLDRERLFLTSKELEKQEKEYRQKFFELQQRLQSFKGEMAAREAHLTESILERLRNIVNNIGKQGGYSLILEKSQAVVLYTPESCDLTSGVIKEYDSNRRSKNQR